LGLHFQYENGWWLLLAIPVMAVLFFTYSRWKKRAAIKAGDPRLVAELTKESSSLLFVIKFLLPALAFAAGVFALMNLRKPGGSTAGTRKGIDVVIALDVSKSMWAADVQPSRLEQARHTINLLIDSMPENRVALVLFAGKAYLQMPLTTDHNAAKLFVASAGPEMIPQQGTVLSDAMEMAERAFNNQERKFKSVVLFSDGEDHETSAISVAGELAAQGVMINTIGVGTAYGSIIKEPAAQEPKKDATSNVVISKLNEQMLKDIAAATNGIYSKLETPQKTVQAITGKLSGIERDSVPDLSLVNFTTWYLWFAVPMFFLLVGEFFIPERLPVGKALKKRTHEKEQKNN